MVGVKGKSTAAYRLVREDTFVLKTTHQSSIIHNFYNSGIED